MCKSDVGITGEGVKLEHPVVMRYLIAGIVTMKQRCVISLVVFITLATFI